MICVCVCVWSNNSVPAGVRQVRLLGSAAPPGKRLPVPVPELLELLVVLLLVLQLPKGN